MACSIWRSFLTRIVNVSSMGPSTVTNGSPPSVTAVERKRIPKDVLQSLHELRSLKILGFSNPDISDDDIDYLRNLKELQTLRFDGNAISATAAVELSALSKLKTSIFGGQKFQKVKSNHCASHFREFLLQLTIKYRSLPLFGTRCQARSLWINTRTNCPIQQESMCGFPRIEGDVSPPSQ